MIIERMFDNKQESGRRRNPLSMLKILAYDTLETPLGTVLVLCDEHVLRAYFAGDVHTIDNVPADPAVRPIKRVSGKRYARFPAVKRVRTVSSPRNSARRTRARSVTQTRSIRFPSSCRVIA
ncbi:MAG: hypothetical protein NVS2B17_13010 [Candidatus Velthaea sp.]